MARCSQIRRLQGGVTSCRLGSVTRLAGSTGTSTSEIGGFIGMSNGTTGQCSSLGNHAEPPTGPVGGLVDHFEVIPLEAAAMRAVSPSVALASVVTEVVDSLLRSQDAAKGLLHDNSMQSSRPSANSDLDVPVVRGAESVEETSFRSSLPMRESLLHNLLRGARLLLQRAISGGNDAVGVNNFALLTVSRARVFRTTTPWTGVFPGGHGKMLSEIGSGG